MYLVKAKVIKNIAVGPAYYKMLLSCPDIARAAYPGQFVNMKVSDTGEPLLRRPLGVHRIQGRNIEVIYEIVGQGTALLAQRKAGEYLEVIGPLGNGFSRESGPDSQAKKILVAGGMGIAPLIFLAQSLAKPRIPDSKPKTLALIGAKTKDGILCEKEFRKLDCDVKIATDDGSRGFKGKVTDLLKHLLPITNYRLPITIYACGPRPMLKEVAKISQQYRIRAQVSLEEHMACGFGACMGCAVKTSQGYKRVCKEGPVFQADEIIW
jgi:dihydroorotate dehydrogenase electron transfer subunit